MNVEIGRQNIIILFGNNKDAQFHIWENINPDIYIGFSPALRTGRQRSVQCKVWCNRTYHACRNATSGKQYSCLKSMLQSTVWVT
jgi:hypothetical protein